MFIVMSARLCPITVCRTFTSIPASAILVHAVCLKICGVIIGSNSGLRFSFSAVFPSFLLYFSQAAINASPNHLGMITLFFRLFRNTKFLYPSISMPELMLLKYSFLFIFCKSVSASLLNGITLFA